MHTIPQLNCISVLSMMMHRFGILSIFCGLMAAQSFLQLASGDSPLIEAVCYISPYPYVCKYCFQLIPGSDKADTRGLGGSSIECAKKKTPIVHQGFVDLASNCSDSQQLTEYQTCIYDIESAGNTLVGAYGCWEGGSYTVAADQVQAALEDFSHCVRQLGRYSFGSDSFIRELTYFKDFMEIAIGILRRL